MKRRSNPKYKISHYVFTFFLALFSPICLSGDIANCVQFGGTLECVQPQLGRWLVFQYANNMGLSSSGENFTAAIDSYIDLYNATNPSNWSIERRGGQGYRIKTLAFSNV